MSPPVLAPLDVAGRSDRVRAAMGSAGVDTLVVSDLDNVRYLTGFTGSNGVLVLRPTSSVLVTDGRYREQAGAQMAEVGVETDLLIARTPDEVLAELVGRTDSVGLEADHVSWATARRWRDLLPVPPVPVEGLVLGVRAVKDPGEVARLHHAASIADAALAAVRPLLDTGVSEADFARQLEAAMVERGASGPSFETIVASGPNGARPHARPTDRVVGTSGDGELVVVDFGATYDGYHSDMTRTFAVGGMSSIQRRMFEVVREAQAAGVAAVAPGVDCRSVDGACRTVVERAGWGDAFVHGTGHGIGLVIHELPRVTAHSSDVLAPGHCVTVEPGVYLPDHGGVRIEDSLVVTEDGARTLTATGYEPER